jgi:hypothetical protein
MWKVKRMNTARIVVITIFLSAGVLAASATNACDESGHREQHLHSQHGQWFVTAFRAQ